MPALDLRTKPKARPAWAEVEDRPRHVGVATLILADGVALRKAENPGDFVSVDEVVDKYASRHKTSLHVVADESYACWRFRPTLPVICKVQTNQQVDPGGARTPRGPAET